MDILENVKHLIEDVFQSNTPDFLNQYDKAPADKKLPLLAQAIKKDADGIFALLRKERPILKTPTGFLITRFADVRQALNDNAVFTVAPYAPKMDPSVGPYMLARDETDINYNDKAIMRSVLRMDDLPKIRQFVAKKAQEELKKSGGKVDVVSQLSRRIPIQVTGEFFGFPGPDEETMCRWSYASQHDMFHNPTSNADIHLQNVKAGKEMREYISGLLPKLRKQVEDGKAADNAFTRIIKITAGGGLNFADDRIVTNVAGLLVGGIETTSQAIVQVLDQLIRVFPDKLEGARRFAQQGNDAAFDAYVWEALRFNPINPFVARLVTKDYVISGGNRRETRIPKGSVALISGRSAMRDETEIPNANGFQTDRPAHHYMHFGFGAHECLGKYVGMVEIAEIVKQVILCEEVKILEPIDTANGPFPERFTIGFKK